MKNEEVITENTELSSRMMRKTHAKRNETREWILSLIIALVAALLLRLFVFEFTGIDMSSMEPTLNTDNYVFMEKVTYWFTKPAYGDVVICKFPNSKDIYVKRVIGVEGDVLEVRDGSLYINGKADTTYFSDYMNGTLPPTVVPDNCIYVMGDNRNVSIDSRDSGVGPISLDKVLGKALFVIWPLDLIRGL